jgi:hypothetical protein
MDCIPMEFYLSNEPCKSTVLREQGTRLGRSWLVSSTSWSKGTRPSEELTIISQVKYSIQPSCRQCLVFFDFDILVFRSSGIHARILPFASPG